MNALNIFLATAGFIITMIGFGIAIIRGAEWAITVARAGNPIAHGQGRGLLISERRE